MRWDNKTRIGEWPSLQAALIHFYKRDRLGDTMAQDARVATTQAEMASEGYCTLASRHESVTGRALWARLESGAVAVYEL